MVLPPRSLDRAAPRNDHAAAVRARATRPAPITGAMPTLRHLVQDGFETLGTITLTDTLVAGDPSLIIGPVGSGGWWGAATRPGPWVVLGRPWASDPDRLDEVVFAHTGQLAAFYELYDTAAHQATLLLPTQRLAVIAGRLRLDPSTLEGAASTDAEGCPGSWTRAASSAGSPRTPLRSSRPQRAPRGSISSPSGCRRPPTSASRPAHTARTAQGRERPRWPSSKRSRTPDILWSYRCRSAAARSSVPLRTPPLAIAPEKRVNT